MVNQTVETASKKPRRLCRTLERLSHTHHGVRPRTPKSVCTSFGVGPRTPTSLYTDILGGGVGHYFRRVPPPRSKVRMIQAADSFYRGAFERSVGIAAAPTHSYFIFAFHGYSINVNKTIGNSSQCRWPRPCSRSRVGSRCSPPPSGAR